MTTQWIGASENNYTKGRGGKSINKICLHWIVGSLESADATFANQDRKASAHYGIANNEIHQWVKEEDTAWHAGNWTINQESIGIEHEGGWLLPDGTRKVPTQITHETSAKLVADICTRYSVPIDREHIRIHKEFSATQCPGTLDANKIIELAKSYQKATSDPEDVARAMKLLEDFKNSEGHGNYEGSMRSLLGAYKDLKSCQNDLNYLKDTEIFKMKENCQFQLESANLIIEELKKQRASEMDWKTLFSIAWKKWWNFKKGGD